MSISYGGHRERRTVFSHWAWAVAALLIAAAFTLYQVDAFHPSVDEFASLLTAGLLHDGYSPLQIIDSLVHHNISHVPGYFLLLSVWGNLTAYDIAIARVLGVLLYLLYLTLFYRLASDFIAPIAGLFALTIVVSSAFFNFYIAHARPYTLFVLLSCLTTWLYLRIVTRPVQPTLKDYVAFGAAIFALVMTHLFSVTLLLALGVYHLIWVAKDRRWLRVGLVTALAIACCLPTIALVLSRFDYAYGHLDGSPLNGIEAIESWLRLMFNNQPVPLMLIVAAGLIVGKRKDRIRLQPWLILPALFAIAIVLLSEFTALIRAQAMRHQLDGWVLVALVAAAGHYGLYRWKPLLGLLPAAWILAGVVFLPATNWWDHVGYRAVTLFQPPFHILARLAVDANPQPDLVGYPYGSFFTYVLSHRGHPGGLYDITPTYHYFGQHGMEISATKDPDELARKVRNLALNSPSIWFFHPSQGETTNLSEARQVFPQFNYGLCDEKTLGFHTVINQYTWELLECGVLPAPATSQTELILYEFYRAGLNSKGDALMFIDKWTPRRDFDTTRYNMSYQLIDEDWSSVAQLDLPLVSQGEVRQFSIDVSDLPSGTYRLMLIMYNAISGDRLAWEDNADFVPEMLPLDQVSIDGA